MLDAAFGKLRVWTGRSMSVRGRRGGTVCEELTRPGKLFCSMVGYFSMLSIPPFSIICILKGLNSKET